jgi:hypothetical protein
MYREELEVNIGITESEDAWRVYASSPRWIRFFTKFAEETGGQVMPLPGGCKFLIPVEALRFAKRQRRTLTDDQRAALSLNMQKVREAKATTAGVAG